MLMYLIFNKKYIFSSSINIIITWGRMVVAHLWPSPHMLLYTPKPDN